MSVQVKRRREAASFLSAYAGAAGELLVDTTNNRVQVHDGLTPGGFPAARLSEVAPLSPLMIAAKGNHGSLTQIGCLEDLVTCSGASSQSTVQIPINAIVFAVSYYVVAAVTGAGRFWVDPATDPGLGAAYAANHKFGYLSSVSAGSNGAAAIGPTAWYYASRIVLTGRNAGDTAGASFTGGSVRIAIHYMIFTPPAS